MGMHCDETGGSQENLQNCMEMDGINIDLNMDPSLAIDNPSDSNFGLG